MTYDVTLFYNTGFDRGNVPASPQILSQFNTAEFPAIFKFQNRGLPAIDIKADFNQVKNADYVKVGDAYYIVPEPPVMLNSTTVRIPLLQDPLTTAGGLQNIEVITGWAVRCHSDNDTIFENILPEPWVPTREMVLEPAFRLDFNPDETLNTGYEHIIGVNVNLDVVNYQALVYENVDGDRVVSVPQQEPPPLYTVSECEGRTYRIPTTLLYRFLYNDRETARTEPALSKALANIRSTGVESCITCSYLIPISADGGSEEWGRNVTSEDPDYEEGITRRGDINSRSIKLLKGKAENKVSDLPYQYGNAKNKKVYALHSTYTIISITSGDTLTFEASELYAAGQSAPEFRIVADLAPNGAIYARPTMYHGTPTTDLQQSVVSASWLNEPLALYGASGSAISNANYRRAQGKASQDLDLNREATLKQNYITSKMYSAQEGWGLGTLAAGATAVAGDVVGLIKGTGGEGLGSSIMSAYTNFQNMSLSKLSGELANEARNLSIEQAKKRYEREMGDMLFSNQVMNAAVAPTILYPQSNTMQCYFGNYFIVLHRHLSNEDAQRLDRFFTAFGYAVDRPIQKKDFLSRTKFNYVKTSSIQLKSATAPREVLESIAAMFNNGVRIWHVPPSSEALSDNPIREV